MLVAIPLKLLSGSNTPVERALISDVEEKLVLPSSFRMPRAKGRSDCGRPIEPLPVGRIDVRRGRGAGNSSPEGEQVDLTVFVQAGTAIPSATKMPAAARTPSAAALGATVQPPANKTA
jgi:hypothetical protein